MVGHTASGCLKIRGRKQMALLKRSSPYVVASHDFSCMDLSFTGSGLQRHLSAEGQKEIIACRRPAADMLKLRFHHFTLLRQATHPHSVLKEGNRDLSSRLRQCHFHCKKESKSMETCMYHTRTPTHTHAHMQPILILPNSCAPCGCLRH